MEYEIIGDNLQMVVTKISSGEMIYMSENMQMNAKAKGGFLKGIKRKLAGETFFTLRGPGHVILQSMTIANLAAALRPFMPSGTSGRSGSPLSIGGLLGDRNGGINDRFMVFISTNSDKDTLYAFANSIDYKGIAALGGGAAPPTETTQGFEALFAIAGLLAVAYLLRRRRG